MKRTILLSAILIALSSSLTACGGGSNTKSEAPPVTVPPSNPDGGDGDGSGNDGGGSDTDTDNDGDDQDNGSGDDGQGGSDPDQGGSDDGDTGDSDDGDQGGGDDGDTGDSDNDEDTGNGGSGGDTPPPPTVYDPKDPLPAPNLGYRSHLDYTNVTDAHERGYTGQGVKVGIIDSGVNADHPSLQGKVRDAFSAVDGPNADPSDPHGHGTMVAQVLAGNHTGRFQGGVAPGVELYVGRTLDEKGYIMNVGASLKFMNDQGVKIVNNSWNLSGYIPPSRVLDRMTGQYANEARRLVENGGLLVFANGNSGYDQPGLYSHLPRSNPELEEGFLTVGALGFGGPDNLPTDELANYSNACGAAKNWCLVAPGTMVVMEPQYDGSTLAYNHTAAMGTSFAAPQVSGAAALVWEAFPWMTNNQVRKTILGTARDIGAPDVDDVFGYGVLDVGRAINGFASLEWGTETFDVSAGTYTFGNTLSGVGGIIKKGQGTLLLDNHNTYEGDTRIEDGTLGVLGSVGTDVSVLAPGHLLLSGRVGGNLDNQGRVTSVAGQVDGNWIQGEDSTIEAVLGAPSIVGGHFQADGTLRLVGLASSDYVVQSTEKVLSAGTVGGQFDHAEFAAGLFLSGTVRYTDRAVELDVVQNAPTSMAFMMATPQAAASAQQLEQAFAVGERVQSDDVTRSLDNTGAFLAGLAQVQRSSTEAQALAAARTVSGQGRVLAASALLATQQQHDGVAFARLAEVANAPAGVFASFASNETTLSPNGWSTTRLRSDDTNGGLDWEVGDARLGVLGQSSRGNLSVEDGLGHYSLRSKTIGVYGHYPLGHGWSVLGQARGTSGKLDGSRTVDLGPNAGTVAHVQDYHQWSMTARFQKVWEGERGTWTAYAGATHQAQTQKASREAGTTGFERGTLEGSFASTGGQVGGQFSSRVLGLGQWGVSWSAGAEYAFRHDHDAMTLDSYYLVDPSSVSSLNGVQVGQNVWRVQASTQFTRGRLSTFLRANAAQGDGVDAWGAEAGVKVFW